MPSNSVPSFELRRGIDSAAEVLVAEAADGVVLLQGEAEGIDARTWAPLAPGARFACCSDLLAAR